MLDNQEPAQLIWVNYQQRSGNGCKDFKRSKLTFGLPRRVSTIEFAIVILVSITSKILLLLSR
jgi:hypothetical protein